jgi:hypothetical protein
MLTTCHVIHPVPSSQMSHAPVGHCLGLSMVTPFTGYQRESPRSWTSSCPRLFAEVCWDQV